MRRLGTAVCFSLLVSGCGDSSSGAHDWSPGGATGGPSATGASGASQEAAGAGEAGVSLGGSDGGGAVAGGSAAGNSAEPQAGAAGAAECPRWPSHRLMPSVGPLFYGPDPGPCTETNLSSTSRTLGTYSFDDTGRVQKVSYENSTRTYNWTDGELTSTALAGSDPANAVVVSYAWSPTKVIEHVPGTGESVREYLLNPAGYPTELWVTNQTTGVRRKRATYSYQTCRLVHRAAFNPDGSVDPGQTADYEYDALGHMSARNDVGGTRSVYDYTCWR